MNTEKFEKICRESKLIPERMVTTENGVIYLAEGYFNRHDEFEKPHFKTVWATARDGMELAQPLYFEFKMGMPSKHERLAKAEQTAREFLNGRRH